MCAFKLSWVVIAPIAATQSQQHAFLLVGDQAVACKFNTRISSEPQPPLKTRRQ